jgi:hypothetical protein
MNDTLTLQNDLIHREADEVLYSRGLFRLLSEYGTVHLTGSYSMNLMTWRDLDIYLESPALSLPDWFTLGGKIAFLLQPARMHFRNELIGQTEGLPKGYYWGIHLNPGQETAWKIDIWTVDPEQCQTLLAYCETFHSKLTQPTRHTIMEIKNQCCRDPQYRRTFFSRDIYRAVLENGVTNLEEFRNYLANSQR